MANGGTANRGSGRRTGDCACRGGRSPRREEGGANYRAASSRRPSPDFRRGWSRPQPSAAHSSSAAWQDGRSRRPARSRISAPPGPRRRRRWQGAREVACPPPSRSGGGPSRRSGAGVCAAFSAAGWEPAAACDTARMRDARPSGPGRGGLRPGCVGDGCIVPYAARSPAPARKARLTGSFGEAGFRAGDMPKSAVQSRSAVPTIGLATDAARTKETLRTTRPREPRRECGPAARATARGRACGTPRAPCTCG